MVLATDNSVVEAVMYKGNSSSEKLFDLVVHLRQAELQLPTKTLVNHIAGTRMISHGTDGVSRIILKEEVADGEDVIKLCPLGELAIETEPKLTLWIITWLPKETIFLEPKGSSQEDMTL